MSDQNKCSVIGITKVQDKSKSKKLVLFAKSEGEVEELRTIQYRETECDQGAKVPKKDFIEGRR